MNPREIIAQAWVYTMKEGGLRRWGFASSFISTILNVLILTVQTWFIISYLQDSPVGYTTLNRVLLSVMPIGAYIGFLVFLAFFICFSWLFPHVARGSIIGLAAKCHRQEEVKGGLVLGLYNFFGLFAVHELLVLSGITSVISLCSIALRFTGSFAPVFIIAILCIWMITLLFEFLWIFSEEAIVIHKMTVPAAIKKSMKLVVSHLGHIVFLMLLLFFIILRIIGNLLMIVIVPGIIIILGYFLTKLVSPIVSYSISSIVGFIIIGIASYFFAYIDVFRQTVWTITYMELSKLKDLDVIESE